MGVIAALMPDLLTTFGDISNKVQIVKLTPYGFVQIWFIYLYFPISKTENKRKSIDVSRALLENKIIPRFAKGDWI